MKKLDLLKKKFAEKILPCEICGQTEVSQLQRVGRVSEAGEYGELSIQVCNNCGFKMLNPRRPDEFFKEYYEELYREVAFGEINPSREYIDQQKKRGEAVLNFFQTISKKFWGVKLVFWSVNGKFEPQVDTFQDSLLKIVLSLKMIKIFYISFLPNK